MPDTALHPYRYSQRGRRPLMWLLLCIGLGATALALALPVPPIAFVPLAIFLAAVLYGLVRDAEHGMSITAQEVRFWGPGLNRRVPIARIDHVRFTRGQDVPERVAIHLRDGTSVEIPTRHLPTAEVLRHEFRRAGIACRDG